MEMKQLKKVDSALEKISARYDKTATKRDDLKTQLIEIQAQRDSVIEQLARDEGDPAALEKHRESVRGLEDRIQVQDEVLAKIDRERQAAMREAYQIEQALAVEWKKAWLQRYEEALRSLKDLLSQAKLCQVMSGTGTGGFEFADKVRSMAFMADPGEPTEQKPASQHLSFSDRERIKEELDQEEAARLSVPPSPRKNEHHSMDYSRRV